jgi:hypothetical protein
MRAFDASKLNLDLLKNPDEEWSTKSEPKSDIKAPYWLRVFRNVGSAILFLGVAVLFRRHSSSGGDLQDFIGIYFWVLVGGLAVLGVLVTLASGKIYEYNRRRWGALAAENHMNSLEPGSHLPGACDEYTGIELAFTIPSEAGKAVSFGVIHDWFDPDGGMQANGYGDFPSQLFVHVELPELSQQVVWVTPRRPMRLEELPRLSDSALTALRRLSSSYTVVIGAGAITVSTAGNTNNRFERSMQNDLTYATGWKLCSSIIRTDLATLVEGLESDS